MAQASRRNDTALRVDWLTRVGSTSVAKGRDVFTAPEVCCTTWRAWAMTGNAMAVQLEHIIAKTPIDRL